MTWWQDTIAAWRWNRAFRKTHPHLKNAQGATGKLRLVLGTARSGTSWLVETLAASSTPLRYWHEPFFRYRPKMRFSDGEDHLAIRYTQTLRRWHPLVHAYHSLTVPTYDWHRLRLDERDLRRNDPDWELCLVKEVHSLLATEGLLNRLNVPALLVVRDPVYIVDSLFDRDGLGSIYGKHEEQYVLDPLFMDRFVPERKDVIQNVVRQLDAAAPRRRVMRRRVLTIALIHVMLRKLAAEHDQVLLVEYEMLCAEPWSECERAAAALGVQAGSQMMQFLEKTMHAGASAGGPHAVVRDTARQLARPFRFMSASDADDSYHMLHEARLGETTTLAR